MKIFVLTIVIFAVGGYVTQATSLDPLDHVEPDGVKNDNDDTRTKRSGEIFSSLIKKKLGLFNSLSGTSSGKSIDHQSHYEEPLSYNTKSFNLWGVKKAIISSVFQAAKAITGGVIALKGQLIKANGHVVVAKGKLMQTKGEAISNFGKTIATHAFDTHHDSHIDEPPSAIGYYNQLPVTPMHQPTSYGAATALGYQGQMYSGNVYPVPAYSSNTFVSQTHPNNAYQVAAQNYQTGFAVPQTGYESGSGYIGYGGNGFTAKRAVQSPQESTNNQAKSDLDKDGVRAGLVIFKPIKMPQSLPGSTAASQSIQQMLGQQSSQSNGIRPTDTKTLQNTGFQNPFPGFQGAQTSGSQGTQGNGFQGGAQTSGNQGAYSGGYQLPQSGGYQLPQAEGYSGYQNPGYQVPNTQYRLPATGGGSDSVEQIPSQGYQLQSFEFQQPANSQEFNQQLTAFSGQQLQPDFSQENNYGSDQHDSASTSEERVSEPLRKATKSKQKAVDRFPGNFFLPTTVNYSGEDSGSGESDGFAAVRSKKRSVPKKDHSDIVPQSQDSIVPLKYHDSSNEEDQARLKHTVQRFFSMLQKQHLPYIRQVARIVHDALGTRKSVDSGRTNGIPEEIADVPLAAQDLRVWGRESSDAEVLEAIATKVFDVYTRHRAELDGLVAENRRLCALVPGPPQPAAAVGRRNMEAAADFVDLMGRVRDAVRNASGHRTRLALVTDRLRAVAKDKRDLLDTIHRNRSSRSSATETADSLRAILDKERRKNEHLQAVVDEMFAAAAAHNDHDRP